MFGIFPDVADRNYDFATWLSYELLGAHQVNIIYMFSHNTNNITLR